MYFRVFYYLRDSQAAWTCFLLCSSSAFLVAYCLTRSASHSASRCWWLLRSMLADKRRSSNGFHLVAGCLKRRSLDINLIKASRSSGENRFAASLATAKSASDSVLVVVVCKPITNRRP